jgi:hypothetical protein
MKRLTILVVGGYGFFGSRIVELLEGDPRLTLIVTGRSREKADTFCNARRQAKAKLVPAVFDRSGDLATSLSALRPDILVDASGPFQSYGSGRYDLIGACIAHGISYLDLADGSDFVNGVAKFDAAARAAGVYILSGASSFPVLTAAAARCLSSDMIGIETIRGGIVPSPYAKVGINVIRAIAGYAGQRTVLRRGGKDAVGFPFTEQMRFTIAPPGHVPVRDTLFSLVDVADLRALARLWPEAKTISMGAGPVPEVLHWTLIALAWLVRLGLLRSLLPFASLLHRASNHLPWGEHRGGMFVEVEGITSSHGPVKRSWHLLAEGNDGPLIPSMAVTALVGRVLDGNSPSAGARAAVRDLEIDDCEKLFAGRTIYTGIRDNLTPDSDLYAGLLGKAWSALPPEIRVMHEGAGIARGTAAVERGRHPLARLIASIIGFPDAGEEIPVGVRFETSAGTETWTRTFGGRSFSSQQFAGRGRSQWLLCERFGPLTFAMALKSEGSRLRLILRRWSAFGIPLPIWLCPRSDSYETSEGGRFRFHVEIRHPLMGLIVRYRGWLER